MDYTIHGILQARILEQEAFPFSRGPSQPRDWIQVSGIAGRFFTSWATREAQEYWVGSLSFLQGIFPTQESNWGLLHCRQILYQLSYQGSPKIEFNCFPKKEVSLFTVKILIYICAWKKEILYLDYSRIQIRPLVICVCTQLLSHIRLFATTMDYSLPGSSVRGIFQARILK